MVPTSMMAKPLPATFSGAATTPAAYPASTSLADVRVGFKSHLEVFVYGVLTRSDDDDHDERRSPQSVEPGCRPHF